MYKYFRFGRPYCYFRLSVVVAIIWGHFLRSRHSSKTPCLPLEFLCCLSQFQIYKYFRFGGHVTTSGRRSLSKPLTKKKNTVFELVIVKNLKFAAGKNVCCFLIIMHGGFFPPSTSPQGPLTGDLQLFQNRNEEKRNRQMHFFKDTY